MNLKDSHWLNENSKVNLIIRERLVKQRASILDYTSANVVLADFGLDRFQNLAFSQFTATKDSLSYSVLLKKALELSPSCNRLIDLGVGSAIPLISALASTRKAVSGFGIDVDHAALAVAENNRTRFGMQERIDLRLESIDDFLSASQSHSHSNQIVASNPPYVSCPDEVKQAMLPVYGGRDGTLYLEKLLNFNFPRATVIALQWGSVTNLVKMFEMIDARYQVLHLQAWEVPFGKYTSSPVVHAHLIRQRTLNLAAFGEGDNGEKRQLIFGAVLVKT